MEKKQVFPSRRPSWSSFRTTVSGWGGFGFLVEWDPDPDPDFPQTPLEMWRFLVLKLEKVASQFGQILSVSIISLS